VSLSSKIKLLVVDDSAFMRSAMKIMVQDDNEINLVAFAKNGLEAIEKVKAYKPDIITLDIEMPEMDGLTALGIIMKECPTPVIMLSSLTTQGAEATLKAFELGALDFISKEMSFVSVNIIKIKSELIKKIKTFAKDKVNISKQLVRNRTKILDLPINFNSDSLLKKNEMTKQLTDNIRMIDLRKDKLKAVLENISLNTDKMKVSYNKYKFLLIGSSTGGPIALQHLLSRLPASFPIPILIVQHMPESFTKSLANRLNQICALTVKEAAAGDKIIAGTVYIAPGGIHMHVKKDDSDYIVHTTQNPYGLLNKPSVDVLFKSVANITRGNIISVVLTGMGKDGLEGVRTLKEKNVFSIAESKSSSVVYGMPRAIVENNLADQVLDINDIGDFLVSLVQDKVELVH
jgi:two-component system, chemotaxis family, protein-glutamate methylesterase/glutaminase